MDECEKWQVKVQSGLKDWKPIVDCGYYWLEHKIDIPGMPSGDLPGCVRLIKKCFTASMASLRFPIGVRDADCWCVAQQDLTTNCQVRFKNSHLLKGFTHYVKQQNAHYMRQQHNKKLLQLIHLLDFEQLQCRTVMRLVSCTRWATKTWNQQAFSLDVFSNVESGLLKFSHPVISLRSFNPILALLVWETCFSLPTVTHMVTKPIYVIWK